MVETKIEIKNPSDGTWRDMSNAIYNAKYIDQGTSALNKITASFEKGVTSTDHPPSYNREIRMSINNSIVFGGKIEKPQTEYPMIEVDSYSYGAELMDKYISEVFENKSPEDIVSDIISNNTDLTFSSSESSGFTISKISFQDKKISEVITQLANTLGWQFWADSDKKFYFEPAGETTSPVTLDTGKNVSNKPKWDYNPDWVVNKVIVEGGNQEFEKATESFTGDFDSVTLTYKPTGNIRIVNGSGTVLDPEVEGSTNEGDFQVLKDEKRIDFTSTQTDPEVTYSYEVPIRVVSEKETDYTEKQIKVKNKSIKSYQEARSTGREILSVRGEPKKSTKIMVPGWHDSFKTGNLIRVKDDNEVQPDGTQGIDEKFLISKVIYDFGKHQTKLVINTNDYKLFNLLHDVDKRLEELEQESSSQDIIQQYKSDKENLNINLTRNYYWYSRDVHDSFILGRSKLGEDKLGSRREGDNFQSYASGNYTFSNYWDTTGTVNIVDSEMVMEAGSSATYINSDTEDFTMADGKINIKFNR